MFGSIVCTKIPHSNSTNCHAHLITQSAIILIIILIILAVLMWRFVWND